MSSKGRRNKLLSLAICFVLTLVVVLAVKGVPYFVNLIEDYRGYDYDARVPEEADWAGPKAEEIIDTTGLLDSAGTPLSKIQKNDLAVLTVVDPECGACKLTRDQFRSLSQNLSEIGVDHFIVTFSRNVSSVKLSEYVRSLNLDIASFAWSNGIETVLPSLHTIAYPSHILIDSHGAVVKSFPGTNKDRNVRDRMVREVVRQVIGEKNRRNSRM